MSVRVAEPVAAAPERPPAVRPRMRRRGAVIRLPLRLSRRGALLMWVTSAFYGAMEVVSYEQAYPDEASRASLERFADSAAARMLQGVPRAVDTTGGFVVWDAGWFLALIVSIWAVLVVTRLLRAEEDAGRADVVLARPVTGVQLLVSSLTVVFVGATGFGLAFALSLVVLGVPAAPSLLFGLGLAGVGITMAALAALAAQLLPLRRSAVSLSMGVIGVLFIVRMVGNSQDSRDALLLLTPFGWLDRLHVFADDRWTGLLPFAVAPVLLTVLARRERRQRDTGGARFAGRDHRAPHLALLSGPIAFGVRTTNGALLAWSIGLAAFGIAMGSLVKTVVDFVQGDDEYKRLLEEMGYDLTNPVEGFLALMGVALALVFAMYVAWRIGALRTEEASGRLEHLLVRPVVRWRWLVASTALAAVAAALVVTASGVGIWVGAVLGDGDVSLLQAVRPMLQTLPLVWLFGGLAVLTFGAVPRLTIGLPVAVAVVTYLLDMLGPLLELPQWLLDLSPFGWLPRPPTEPFDPVAATVLVLVGVALAAVGTVLFARRDVTGE